MRDNVDSYDSMSEQTSTKHPLHDQHDYLRNFKVPNEPIQLP